jgi:Cof subfamily protein (haloacid dehalogenase superfamily)
VAATDIRLLLADVDGTLVTPDKVLTPAAVDAVRKVRDAGVLFAVTSGRPPRGMAMLVDPLGIDTPIAAFNGGLIVDRDLQVIEARVLPEDLVRPVVGVMSSLGLDVWVYRGAEWYVPDRSGPHVEREAWTVHFEPQVMDTLEGLTDHVTKLVGVNDDHESVVRAADAVHEQFGDHVAAATSQPYYLDVTHPDANKGAVARFLADRYRITTDQIATIGDMPNDVRMFEQSGLSIAMGNAEADVQRHADHVTDDNQHEGFAKAVERVILREG